jgi:CubicO group peptidase (beta-lactamase class C family)
MRKNNFLYFSIALACFALVSLLFVSCKTRHTRNTSYSYLQPKFLNDNIQVDNIKNAGIDSFKIIELTQLILKDSFPNIHSLLIVRNNKLVYEHYFFGKDEDWGSNLGYVKHDTNTLHDIRSISKSVVAACVDIAIQQKIIKSIDEPIFNYLPNYANLKTTANEKITIRHFLTMSSGIKWDEDVPHGTSKNNETQMERSINPVEYVLSQAMNALPGTTWKYNSGGVQVLAEIIRNASGSDIDKFAEKYLFEPLDIRKYSWTKSSSIAIFFHLNKLFSKRRKFPAAASGLRLRSRDLLKFGSLYLNNGKWNGQQVLSGNFVKETLTPQIPRESNSQSKGYSYLFWTEMDSLENNSYQSIVARGNGGQRIFVCKALDLLVIITAGNYNKPNIVNGGQIAFRKFILPAIKY